MENMDVDPKGSYYYY